jgi:GDP-L-fucose synthase
MLCQIIGYTGKIKWDASKPTGSQRRQMDVSKAWKEFGFKASTGLRDGLKKTINHWNSKVSYKIK